MSLDDPFDQVAEFHRRFGHPVAGRPKLLQSPRSDVRVAWMREEIDEFVESKDVVDQADAMIDLIYFALGTLVEMGVRPGPLFDIVHGANMAKLWPDGSPRVRADGKTIKPPTWRDPFEALRAEIERQSADESS
jgi:predicted HAD superfamily Cof-like phosphohydrolase